MFKDTKARLSEWTKIKGKQFDKIKFAIVSKPHFSRPDYLDDGKSWTYSLYKIVQELM